MASGQDPLADMQNLMGYAGLVGPNPYLKYQGQIPIAGYYTGYNDTAVLPGGSGYMPPTNAQGKEIGRYETEQTAANNLYQQQLAAYNAAQPPAATPGTTLNSAPGGYPAGSAGATPAIQELLGNYAASQAALSPGQQAAQAASAAVRNQQLQQQANLSAVKAAQGGFGNMPGGAFNPGSGYTPSMGGMMGAGAGAAAPAGPPPPTPPNMRQIYLDALANPGPVQQYGAAPPTAGQTPTGSPGPNVMSAFLAANAGKNTPFINTLKGIQGAT